MNDYTGADLFVETLERYGVRHVFGNPGTTELPVVNALSESDVEYVLGLHEDVAVGMAAGYASTRRYHAHDDPEVLPVGVVNLHLSPGLAHGLGNLYGASVAGAPLVVTAGNHSRDVRHEEPILGGDLVAMAEPFTKWSAEVLDADTLPTMLRRAVRVALTPPTGPVFLALPLDTMVQETDARPERLGSIPTAGRGDAREVVRAANVLVAAEEPVIVVGDEVARADAVDAAVDLAEASGARVHGEILSAEVNFPGDHEQWAGFLPSSAEPAKKRLATDAVAFVGCSTNAPLVTYDRPLVPAETTCVHVGPDPWELAKNQPGDAVVVGDPGPVVDEMAGVVSESLPDGVLAERRDQVQRWKRGREPSPVDVAPGDRPTKGALVEGLRGVAPDAFVVDEGVTSKYELLRRWPFRRRQFLSNKGGGLGYGLPASVGAAIAEGLRDDPRDVVGFVGDGSYLYYPHAVYSAARYDVDLTVVVSDNRNYRILKDNTLSILGGEEDDYDFSPMEFGAGIDIPATAAGYGLDAHRVETAGDLEETLRGAVRRDGPGVVDVLVRD